MTERAERKMTGWMDLLHAVEPLQTLLRFPACLQEDCPYQWTLNYDIHKIINLTLLIKVLPNGEIFLNISKLGGVNYPKSYWLDEQGQPLLRFHYSTKRTQYIYKTLRNNLLRNKTNENRSLA